MEENLFGLLEGNHFIFGTARRRQKSGGFVQPTKILHQLPSHISETSSLDSNLKLHFISRTSPAGRMVGSPRHFRRGRSPCATNISCSNRDLRDKFPTSSPCFQSAVRSLSQDCDFDTPPQQSLRMCHKRYVVR